MKQNTSSTGQKRKKEKKQNLLAVLFMIPGIVGLFLFYLFPFGTVVRFSFSDNTVAKASVGFKNYVELFGNETFRLSITNSGILAVGGTILLICLALFVAEFLSHAKWFTSVVKTVMLTPFVMPAACIALIFSLCTNHSKVFLKIFQMMGLGGSFGLDEKYALLFLLLLFLWKNLGYFVMLFSGSLINVNKSIIEAAELDGAGVVRIFFDIKLRTISPSILFAVLLSVMSSFGMYREVFLIYGSHPPASAYLISHYLNNTMRNMNYSKMSASALLVMVAVMILSVVLILLERRYGRGMEQ